jgi:cytochrome c556
MTETRIRTRLSRSAALVATVLGLSAIAVPASADLTLNNDQILAVRQAVMRTNSAFNGLVAAQAKGAVTIPPDQLKAIGEAWLRYGKLAPALFPAGSGMDKNPNSKAKPEIWSDAAGFKTKLDAYAKATADFQAAATKGDAEAVKVATDEVGKSCQGCHETYRAR